MRGFSEGARAEMLEAISVRRFWVAAGAVGGVCVFWRNWLERPR